MRPGRLWWMWPGFSLVVWLSRAVVSGAIVLSVLAGFLAGRAQLRLVALQKFLTRILEGA